MFATIVTSGWTVEDQGANKDRMKSMSIMSNIFLLKSPVKRGREYRKEVKGKIIDILDIFDMEEASEIMTSEAKSITRITCNCPFKSLVEKYKYRIKREISRDTCDTLGCRHMAEDRGAVQTMTSGSGLMTMMTIIFYFNYIW